MKTYAKIYILDNDGKKFFGEGPYRLLMEVEKSGSLRSAANTMEMSYTKALKLLSTAEKALGFPLTARTTGGDKGGGSILTKEGKEWCERYGAYRDACRDASEKLFGEFFPEK